MMSPGSIAGMKLWNRCRSEPQIAQLVTLTIASRESSISGSVTVSQRISSLPCQTSARIGLLRDSDLGNLTGRLRALLRRTRRITDRSDLHWRFRKFDGAARRKFGPEHITGRPRLASQDEADKIDNMHQSRENLRAAAGAEKARLSCEESHARSSPRVG